MLVANRGEIARRICRTAEDMGLETVVVYADGDADAPFVDEADQAVALGGRTAAETYLDQAKILDAARRTGADAVHPGYGFLSENAEFAQAVLDAGLIWIGPPPAAIAAMGDKLAAKKLMAEAGVPVLPSVEVPTGGPVDNEADEQIDGELTAMASAIGYPVLVKAAAGGGGKGMRVVDEPEQLATAVAGAQREAEAAFGDGTVFLEKYLTASRHVEIQILGDTHGNVVHCHERECSIQRRHQKIIEEAPCTAIAADTASAMGAAAIAAAQAIDYHSAGTVEFLVATEPDGSERFYFLEVNTRLQVEHPVTEEVTGLDLVREQIQVANGEALTFGQDDIELSGHAIEVRLYAEDPDAGFLPATGTLHAFGVDDVPEVRVESGVVSGSVIGTEFDPMLAKVIAHAPTRTEAARKLATALERMTTFGITTNRDHLVRILRHPKFLAGNTTTDFLERVDLPPAGVEPAVRRSLLAAAVVARQAANRAEATALDFMPSGFRNSVMPPERLQYQVDGDEVSVAYRSQRDGTFEVTVEGHETPIVVRHEDQRAPFVQDLSIDGVRSRYTIVRAGRRWYVQGPLGRLESVEVPRFPEPGGDDVAGGQLAPMPGAVRVVAVAVGDEVEAGQPLVVLEAMKMEHTVTAPEAAVVTEVRCTVGDQVDNGAVLVVLEAGSA